MACALGASLVSSMAVRTVSKSRGTAVALLAAALVVSTRALAEENTAAGALFDQGVADMLAGRLEQACPKLQESQRLDPRPGTLFTLAECEAKAGKLASSVAHYEEYLNVVAELVPERKARHRERVATASSQLQRLKPSVPSLTLVLPASSEPSTTVMLNGVALPGTSLGVPTPIDPGPYTVVTRTPAGLEHSVTFSLVPGEQKRVELEVAASPSVPAPPGSSVSDGSTPSSAPAASLGAPAPDSHHSSNQGRKTLAYALGGVGIAGIAVGSITGILVFGKKGTVDDNCDGTSCNPSGLSAVDSGRSLALVSNIGFGVGIAGLAAGAILLLTAPKEESLAATRWQPLLVGDSTSAWAGVRRRF